MLSTFASGFVLLACALSLVIRLMSRQKTKIAENPEMRLRLDNKVAMPACT